MIWAGPAGPFFEVIVMELGPFHGRNLEVSIRSEPYTGAVVAGERDAAVLKALCECGAMSGNQVRKYLGVEKLRPMERLVRKGIVDAYAFNAAPPVYALGRGGAEILDVPYRRYGKLELLRLVAANQLWLWLRKAWPDASWDVSWDYPVLNRSGREYLVAAPRLVPGESVYVARAFALSGRVFVVAASKEQVEEFPLPPEPEMVRYTWDVLLKDGLFFYRLDGSFLVPDRPLAAVS